MKIIEFIKKYQPIIAMAGHLHENAEVEDKINKTRVINPGPNGMLLDL
jgi:Icc-related predicted phosphoesterase